MDLLLFLIVLCLAAVFLALAIQCCGLRGVLLGSRPVSLEPRNGLTGQPFTRAMAWRCLLWGAATLGAVYFLSALECIHSTGSLQWDVLLSRWYRWDASNYRRIAELGYGGFDIAGKHTTLVFFPLYPWLMRLLHLALPDWRLCGHVLSCLCYVGACYMFGRLMTEEFGWETARLGLGLLAAYPFSFFFAATFAESLFLLLTVSAFYCIRRHRWLAAGVLGALAALARMQGALLLPAGFVEYCVTEKPLQKLRRRDWHGLGRDLVRVLLPLALTLTGTGIYLLVNWYVDGDPFQFLTYQKDVWYQGFAPLPSCLRTMWRRLLTEVKPDSAIVLWGAQLGVFALSFGTLLYSAFRLPPAWTAYFYLYTLMNFSLSWPISCGRYMACAFPLFAALAVLGRRRPTAGQFALLALALLLPVFLFAYLAGGQVM